MSDHQEWSDDELAALARTGEALTDEEIEAIKESQARPDTPAADDTEAG